MNGKSRTIPLILICGSLFFSGCFYSREITQIRRDIERQYPDVHFEREVVVSLGPTSIRTLNWLSGFVDDDDVQMAREYLYNVNRVKLGVYRVDNLPSLDEIDLSRLERVEDEGWQVAVKAREEDSLLWIMYSEDHEIIRNIYILALDEGELVVARVQGDLQRILERAMEDHSDFWRFVHRD